MPINLNIFSCIKKYSYIRNQKFILQWKYCKLLCRHLYNAIHTIIFFSILYWLYLWPDHNDIYRKLWFSVNSLEPARWLIVILNSRKIIYFTWLVLLGCGEGVQSSLRYSAKIFLAWVSTLKCWAFLPSLLHRLSRFLPVHVMASNKFIKIHRNFLVIKLWFHNVISMLQKNFV